MVITLNDIDSTRMKLENILSVSKVEGSETKLALMTAFGTTFIYKYARKKTCQAEYEWLSKELTIGKLTRESFIIIEDKRILVSSITSYSIGCAKDCGYYAYYLIINDVKYYGTQSYKEENIQKYIDLLDEVFKPKDIRAYFAKEK